jgi:uncharacterized membrane protein YfcA
MIFGSESLSATSELGGVAQTLIALGIGLVSGFFAGVAGVGGGIVIVPATVLLLGFTQHEAQGTSLLAIILTSAAATYVNRRNRRVSLRDALVVGGVGAVAAVAASRVALGIEGRVLSVAFGLLAVFIAGQTLYRAWRVEGRTA